MITFIYGNYGSGKTTRILEKIKSSIDNGKRTFLIVPEQEAVSAERMTLESFPPSAQLKIEVLNFSRLYNRVCREYGGISYRYITKTIRHLLMWQNLRELAPCLEEYGELAASEVSMCDLMISAVNEFKSCAISPDMLERAAKKLREDDPLRHKLIDLAWIYGSFDHIVSKKYSDSADDLSKLYDKLKEYDFFYGCDVYIDSFTSFTAVEHKIIERIFAGASNVAVSIPIPTPDFEGNYTESVRNSLNTLKKNADKHGGANSEILGENRRAKSQALAYLTENLWKLDVRNDIQKETRSNGSIIMEKCENTYAEVEAASAHILELLRNGARCRDIAVIARDPARYKGIIEPAFQKNGIPLFVSEKTELCSLAPLKLILSALRIRRFNWQRSDVIAHIKTGLYSIEQRKIDLFEEYVNTWNIRGARFIGDDWTMNPDGYQKELSYRAKDILSCANEVRRAVIAPLSKLFVLLDAAENIADMCRAIFIYIEDIGLEDQLYLLAQREAKRGRKKSASEFGSLYGVILDTLANIGEAMEDEKADVEEFYLILKTAFEQTEIGTIPTSIDEVIFGSAATMRPQKIKYAFILGLCESVFPAAIRDNGVFSAGDRERLTSLNIELSGNIDTRASDELAYVLRAFSTPSEKLYLFTVTSELGVSEPRLPSLAFNRVKKLFPDITVHDYSGNDFSYLVGTPQSSISHLRSMINTAEGKALRLATEKYIPEINTRLDKKSYSSIERLSDTVISDKKYTDITLSFSKFEKYVSCPFKYFCSAELKLRDSGRAKFEFNDAGTFVHNVLEKLLKYAVTELEGGATPSKDLLTQKGNEIVDEYISEIFPQESDTHEKLAHLFKRLKKLSRLVIENILEEMEHSQFRPAFFELNTNGEGTNPSPMYIEPEDKSYKVTFTGVIDRVDLLKKDGKIYVRIVDYKTGTKTFSLEDIEHGMNLQMLLYLCTLCNNKDNEFTRAIGLKKGETANPAGIIYLLAKVPVISLEDYTQENDVLQQAETEIERNGLLLGNEDILMAMNDNLSPQFIPGISKDGSFNANALISEENFKKIFNDMEKVILRITNEMRSGCADARPLQYGGKDPCSYCEVKSICRHIKNINKEGE